MSIINPIGISEIQRIHGITPTGRATMETETITSYDDGSHRTSITEYSFTLYNNKGNDTSYQNKGNNVDTKA